MISFEGVAPDWDKLPATRVISVSEFFKGATSLVLHTDAGPLNISLYRFGARLTR